MHRLFLKFPLERQLNVSVIEHFPDLTLKLKDNEPLVAVVGTFRTQSVQKNLPYPSHSCGEEGHYQIERVDCSHLHILQKTATKGSTRLPIRLSDSEQHGEPNPGNSTPIQNILKAQEDAIGKLARPLRRRRSLAVGRASLDPAKE